MTVRVNGHELDWQVRDHEYMISAQMYGMKGPIGRTHGQDVPAAVLARCRVCRAGFSVEIDRETWLRLRTWERQPLGDALAGRAAYRERLTCEDVRNLRICREVMET